MILTQSHPAITESKSIHTKTLQGVDENSNLLKSASANTKMGGFTKKFMELAKELEREDNLRYHSIQKDDRIIVSQKSMWMDFPVYTLTLEERKTCPDTCFHWHDCYGNGMGFATRWEHGKALEKRIKKQIRKLAKMHPNGFVVRLHILGDFYSIEYVRMWGELLARHKNMNIYGYSARLPIEDEIGTELFILRSQMFDRFKMRFSNWDGEFTALSEHTEQAKKQLKSGKAIVCPNQVIAQDGLPVVKNCLSCGLCWTSNKSIVFKDNGKKGKLYELNTVKSA